MRQRSRYRALFFKSTVLGIFLGGVTRRAGTVYVADCGVLNYTRNMSDVTVLLKQIEQGDSSATKQLLPLVYNELRSLATLKMRRERPDMTLQATALVHEVYMRLVGGQDDSGWENRAHFFAAAAESMRRILVEAARRKSRLKRGGDRVREEFDDVQIDSSLDPDEIVTIHEALDKLESAHLQAAQLVKMRYFAGFTINEAATMLDISPRKANQLWAYAKAWLLDEIGDWAK